MTDYKIILFFALYAILINVIIILSDPSFWPVGAIIRKCYEPRGATRKSRPTRKADDNGKHNKIDNNGRPKHNHDADYVSDEYDEYDDGSIGDWKWKN